MESRIHGDMYVRFGGRLTETYHRKVAKRCWPSLLKEIGKECKLEKHLTFNFARHTFICTIIMGNDLETSIVNKLIGRKVQGNSKITDFQLYKAMKTVSEKSKGNNIINI